MAMQTMKGLMIPAYPWGATILQAGTAFSTVSMTASGHKVAILLECEEAGTIDTIAFRTSTVTTGDTIKVSLQDNSSGLPDGVVDQYRTISIADNDDNVWKETGLITSDGTDGGSKRTVAVGDLVWVVFEFSSYVAGNLSLAMVGLTGDAVNNRSFVTTYDGATWTTQTTRIPNIAVKFADGSYPFFSGVFAWSAATSISVASNTNPDEVALAFKPPTKVRARGLNIHCDLDGPADFILYDTDGSTVLETRSLTASERRTGSGRPIHVPFATPRILTVAPSNPYRAVLKPTSTTTILAYYFDVAAAAILDAMSGGQKFYWSQRVDGGSWTDTLTRRLLASVSCDQGDDGASGGVARPLPGNGGFIIG